MSDILRASTAIGLGLTAALTLSGCGESAPQAPQEVRGEITATQLENLTLAAGTAALKTVAFIETRAAQCNGTSDCTAYTYGNTMQFRNLSVVSEDEYDRSAISAETTGAADGTQLQLTAEGAFNYGENAFASWDYGVTLLNPDASYAAQPLTAELARIIVADPKTRIDGGHNDDVLQTYDTDLTADGQTAVVTWQQDGWIDHDAAPAPEDVANFLAAQIADFTKQVG